MLYQPKFVVFFIPLCLFLCKFVRSFANMIVLYTLECDDGYFGPNCIDKCNRTCRSCNKKSGICDNGCQPGWRGLYCQDGILCYGC